MKQNTKKKPKSQNGEKRKTSHGITCPHCGCKNVRVTTTRSRTHPAFMERHIRTRVTNRRQRCECQAEECGHRWWRSVKVSEQEAVGKRLW